jgi:signal-transduction protein with cAMP-binding, CBS, and nucleotidyltransferase domain
MQFQRASASAARPPRHTPQPHLPFHYPPAQDINRLRKQGLDLTSVKVKDYMSTPPIVVRTRAHISDAAALMLDKRIHRLPVVDEEGKFLGIVSRTDIFRPLLNPKEDVFQALSVAGNSGLQSVLEATMSLDADDEALSTEESW